MVLSGLRWIYPHDRYMYNAIDGRNILDAVFIDGDCMGQNEDDAKLSCVGSQLLILRSLRQDGVNLDL